MLNIIVQRWEKFWMKRAGLDLLGRVATNLAELFAPAYKARTYLAWYSKKGYLSSKSIFAHHNIQLGDHVFIGDRITIYGTDDGGAVKLGGKVALYSDIVIETCDQGSIDIGDETHIQPRCTISAGGKASVIIGKRVEIASNCAFYPYNHAMKLGIPIREQPLTTNGDITIEDDVWLGYGVIVLSGVKIGKGAVIGACSVVTKDIPDNAIATGIPAEVRKYRTE